MTDSQQSNSALGAAGATIPFIWDGKELRTIGDLIDAIGALASEEEAQRFIAEYRRCEPEVADRNAGYVTGYLDSGKAERLRQRMGTPHPVFGMGTPTPEEAFAAGMREAERNASK